MGYSIIHNTNFNTYLCIWSIGLGRMLKELNILPQLKKEVLLSWSPPPLNKIKINSDGVLKGNFDLFTTACTLRDE